MFKRILFTSMLIFFLWSACHHTTEQAETHGAVQGTVQCLLPDGPGAVHPAFIISGDTHITTTDAHGHYRIDALKIGTHELTASALFCGDTTLSVQVLGGHTVTLDFTLTPDSAMGRVYGEFQDGALYQQRLQEDTALVNWSEQYKFDAATGATLQYKTLQVPIIDCNVILGDSTMTTADAWGQYFLKIPSGTYPITGSCQGYEKVTHIVRVLPDSRNYINFVLPRVMLP